MTWRRRKTSLKVVNPCLASCQPRLTSSCIAEWWDAEDYHAWENRKRKRAKARGERDSDEERELSKKKSKKARIDGDISIAAAVEPAQDEHFSD
jgi:hypothetical protein